jgi:hypothetical protein
MDFFYLIIKILPESLITGVSAIMALLPIEEIAELLSARNIKKI